MNSFKSRSAKIEKLQGLRDSHVICYLTSLRPNVPAQMSQEEVRVFFEHLPKKAVKRIDVLLVSNGGDSVVPWRLVSLCREFTKHLGVLIPFRAYSAATLLALGADEIVMHPFAEMGPIDPSVSNEFNPVNPSTGQRMQISVEDVKAYVNFIKSTVGINHEDELVQAITILANQVHPLALGNVERFISQSRMMASKILRTHMSEAQQHQIEEIVENMASKLFFHGHPINRVEAREDLNLKVNDPAPDVEKAMWSLYLDYEELFGNTVSVAPINELNSRLRVYREHERKMVHLQARMQHLAANPTGDAAANAATLSKLHGELLDLQLTLPETEVEVKMLHAVVESRDVSSCLTSERLYRAHASPQMPSQYLFQEDILSLGWSHSRA